MAYSKAFNTLRARASSLRSQFLPKRFSKLGAYSDKQLDGARAFRVLIHAEIEYYLEVRALEIANLSFNLWLNQSVPSNSLVSLLCNIIGEHTGLPRELGTKKTPSSVIGKAVAQYNHSVNNNNGIRSMNVLQILLPVGVLESQIDPVWLSTTDGFAVKRGATAHSTAISYQIDPRDDYQIIQQIIKGIKDIDKIMNSIIQTLK
ncbi:hypothetical protein [Thalassobaculum sp.]|uniref:hypothetical protein n=1 Tax=Thalassobaculum sp. TaxID=2022740 RepID=UPI0032ECFECD